MPGNISSPFNFELKEQNHRMSVIGGANIYSYQRVVNRICFLLMRVNLGSNKGKSHGEFFL